MSDIRPYILVIIMVYWPFLSLVLWILWIWFYSSTTLIFFTWLISSPLFEECSFAKPPSGLCVCALHSCRGHRHLDGNGSSAPTVVLGMHTGPVPSAAAWMVKPSARQSKNFSGAPSFSWISLIGEIFRPEDNCYRIVSLEEVEAKLERVPEGGETGVS